MVQAQVPASIAENLANLALEGEHDPRGGETRDEPSWLHYQMMWPFPFFRWTINMFLSLGCKPVTRGGRHEWLQSEHWNKHQQSVRQATEGQTCALRFIKCFPSQQSSGKCQNQLQPLADCRGCSSGLGNFYFPFAQSRQECPHLGALESFYLAGPSAPFLGNFLHISKPQMYPWGHFLMLQSLCMCIIQLIYIMHEVGMNLPHNTCCKKSHTAEISSELSLTKMTWYQYLAILGWSSPFQEGAGVSGATQSRGTWEKAFCLQDIVITLLFCWRAPGSASLPRPLRRCPPYLAPDTGPGDGAPGGGTDISFGKYTFLCGQQLHLRAPSCGCIWELFPLQEPSQRFRADYKPHRALNAQLLFWVLFTIKTGVYSSLRHWMDMFLI